MGLAAALTACLSFLLPIQQRQDSEEFDNQKKWQFAYLTTYLTTYPFINLCAYSPFDIKQYDFYWSQGGDALQLK